MNYITKYEADNKELASKFSIQGGVLVFDENSKYKDEFQVGDIVASKNDAKKIGVVSFIEEEQLDIIWTDNSESTEHSADLVIVPPTIGLQLIKNSDLLKTWENLSNGKNDSFDLKCIYINDEVINEVPFIRAYKNTDIIVDKRFKRKFSLYRKFSHSQIFRANIYTICDGEVKLDENRFAYYLLEDHVVYFLGIDLKPENLSVYLFRK